MGPTIRTEQPSVAECKKTADSGHVAAHIPAVDNCRTSLIIDLPVQQLHSKSENGAAMHNDPEGSFAKAAEWLRKSGRLPAKDAGLQSKHHE